MSEKMRKLLLIICTVVFLCCLGGLGYYFVGRYIENQTAKRVSELVAASSPTPSAEPTPTPELTPEPTPHVVIDKYAELYSQNPETIGWLRIDDTIIDYVVMQTPQDPEKYLHLDFFGGYSSQGSLFLDYRDDIWTSDNLIIYGHHQRDGSMFGTLESFRYEDYWKNHKYITFDTIYQEQTFEIVATFYARVLGKNEEGFRYYHFIEADSQREFDLFKDFIEENRCYDTGVDFDFGDQLLTLSTCSYQVENGRFAVIAKRVDPETDVSVFTTPKQEDPAPTAAPDDTLPQDIPDESPALAAAPDPGGSSGSFSTDLIVLALLLVSFGVASAALLRLARRK